MTSKPAKTSSAAARGAVATTAVARAALARRALAATSFVLLLGGLGTLGATRASAAWPLGTYGGRAFQRIELPGQTCGGGAPYAIYFAPAPDPAELRLTIHFQGGGSTKRKADGEIFTVLSSLAVVRERLTVEAETSEVKRLFMDHQANDPFIGPGHWLVVPYCTQDYHSGQRADAEVYDFTDLPDNRVKSDAEALLNRPCNPPTVEQIEAAVPGVDIDGVTGAAGDCATGTSGTHRIQKIYVRIVHRGALNAQAALDYALGAIEAASPRFAVEGQVLVAGGSAGGFGAFYNFWRVADRFAAQPAARLTLAPMGGAPAERWWRNANQDIVLVPEHAQEIVDEQAFYGAERACDVAGGDFVPGAVEDCNDALELLDHYRLRRYPGRDVRYAPVINKEDAVAVSRLENPADILPFCKTVHRYAQYMALRPDTFPYAPWQFFKEPPSQAIQRVHVPDRANILVVEQRPNGAATPSPYSLLEFLNRVASRAMDGLEPLHIEYLPFIVNDANDPESGVTPYTAHLAEQVGGETFAACNVPRPVTVETSSLKLTDDVDPPLDPRRRDVHFRASTRRSPAANRVVPPAPGSDGDPTLPASGGGTLRVYNSRDGDWAELATASLPAAAWQLIGSPERPRGFRYRSSDPAAPITRVDVKQDHIVVRGGGESWAYTLDEASQGSIAVRLKLGTGYEWCGDAPARAQGDPPSSERFDHPGLFRAQPKSPPPGVCVTVPAYGSAMRAFLDPPATLLD